MQYLMVSLIIRSTTAIVKHLLLVIGNQPGIERGDWDSGTWDTCFAEETLVVEGVPDSI